MMSQSAKGGLKSAADEVQVPAVALRVITLPVNVALAEVAS